LEPHFGGGKRHLVEDSKMTVETNQLTKSGTRSRFILAALAAVAGAGVPLAAQDPPAATAAAQLAGDAEAAVVIAKFEEKDSRLTKVFADAAGYAVFPTVAKGAIAVGAARGKGFVYEKGKVIGRSTLTQVSIGFQAGGQAYSEVVIFKTSRALENFKLGHLKLDAQASAVALTERVAEDLAYRDDVAIVTMAKGGLMYEASIGGQKFSFHPTEPKS
jgi:lipid-binding SYLF domain-containing protein